MILRQHVQITCGQSCSRSPCSAQRAAQLKGQFDAKAATELCAAQLASLQVIQGSVISGAVGAASGAAVKLDANNAKLFHI